MWDPNITWSWVPRWVPWASPINPPVKTEHFLTFPDDKQLPSSCLFQGYYTWKFIILCLPQIMANFWVTCLLYQRLVRQHRFLKTCTVAAFCQLNDLWSFETLFPFYHYFRMHGLGASTILLVNCHLEYYHATLLSHIPTREEILTFMCWNAVCCFIL